MSDTHLQRTFDKLRDADRGQTPPFDVMRARALALARSEPVPRRTAPACGFALFATASVVIAVCVAAWIWKSQPTEMARSSPAKRVEQLVAAIDARLAARLAVSDLESPTDFLLTKNKSTTEKISNP
jgi:hypothetical protein